MNTRLLAHQITAVRASLVAALEQCDAIAFVLEEQSAKGSTPDATGDTPEPKGIFTFGEGKVPSPHKPAGE